MGKYLVYSPVSYKEGYSMSAQMSMSNKNGVEVYLKNAFVMLKSVQKHNADVDTAIVVNFTMSDFYRNLFESNNIAIYQIAFADYTMPPHFTWSLAFFKIAALKWITKNTEYEYTLQLESDMICLSGLDDMWKELDVSILTMYSHCRFDHPVRKKYSDAFNLIYPNEANPVIVKTGAGFIAGKRDKLLHFVEACDEMYAVLKENLDKVDIKLGDEMYTSLYCAAYPHLVKPANPYVDVYWTGTFYFVSTNHHFDAVSVIHLPAEKEFGMLTLYDYFRRKGRLPDNKFIARVMRFPSYFGPISLRRFYRRVRRKLKQYFGDYA